MNYRVLIRRNSDGVERWTEHAPADPADLVEYIWMGGNYACDCNRGDFFAETAGEPDEEHVCGGNAFTVLRIERDGAVLAYSSDEEAIWVPADTPYGQLVKDDESTL